MSKSEWPRIVRHLAAHPAGLQRRVGPGGLAQVDDPDADRRRGEAPARAARPRARRRSASPPASRPRRRGRTPRPPRPGSDPCGALRRSRAWRRAASTPGRRPTPSVPLAPRTSTVSSGFTGARHETASHAVRPAMPQPSAVPSPTPSGMSNTHCACSGSTTSAISCRPRTQTRRPSLGRPDDLGADHVRGRRRAAVEAAVRRSRCRSGSARRSRRERARRPAARSISSTCGTPPISCRRAARTAVDYERSGGRCSDRDGGRPGRAEEARAQDAGLAVERADL